MPADDFFRARLDQMIDLHHPSAILANRVPWPDIEATLAPAFKRKNRQGQVVKFSDIFGTALATAGTSECCVPASFAHSVDGFLAVSEERIQSE